ncbi:cold shock domain-containing protein [Natronosporangium hydrolyticum]|uniref:Cold shock domain-containing protein n=1 Tax=Natronosporangium hydrolyticum TaxID=2811111 RepID=A0A895YPK2_9ACTN|nr:cold shock domain-containing protein [Natronosporangium hydrolyticum]QSB16040.1 cold shock domain-containing protein [Natronosporangium hydrolyticum]
MRTGRIVQFDEARGFGFITPDQGGEDVFVHVNLLGNDRWLLAPGVAVEFESTEGERGPKALAVRVLRSDTNQVNGGVVPSVAPAVSRPATSGNADDSDELCDVLQEQAFLGEITEVLLTSTPDLSAGQVVKLRREILNLARRHGWVEDD